MIMMNKQSLLATLSALLACQSSLAFAPPQRPSTVFILRSTTDDNLTELEAVQAALDATQKYGVVSSQARVLWDVVEEIRAQESHEANNAGGLGMSSMMEECLLDENGISEACMEYHEKMSQLTELMDLYQDWRDLVAEQHIFDNFKSLTQDLSHIKFNVNLAKKQAQSTSNSPMNPEQQEALTMALQDAKQITDEFGIHSSEAKLAWETVEEVASTGLEHAMGGSTSPYYLLDEECLVEQASEACRALEELNQKLNDSKEAAQKKHP